MQGASLAQTEHKLDSKGSDMRTPTAAMRRHFSTLKTQDVWRVLVK